jgi:predicted TIM-barrel fold metal-dependent hydrolase
MPARDPDGTRLPIKIDSTSNGEFAPIALDDVQRHGNALASESATRHARRLGLARRQFMVSACGAASTLLALNAANAAAGRSGGSFELPSEAAEDLQLAAASVHGEEFILDVQGHFVNPHGAWLKGLPADARPLEWFPQASCELSKRPGERSYLECLGSEQFVKDVFLDSDTDLMVLSFVPSRRDSEPLTIEEAAATRDIVARLEGAHRLLLHGRVNPNQDGDLQGMDELKERWDIAAWKTYTQWGPQGKGFFLNDEVGIRFVEKARALGVKRICVHKGLPFGRESYEHSLCDDIGPVAKRFPDVAFLVYHSGFVAEQPERAFDPAHNDGIDSLIGSLQRAGIGHGSNVYAELGSTWRYLMREPDSAAHALGKLLKHLGPDNVLWGTDSIWYGSPQDQIQAFRTFQISERLQEQHGYPALDATVRAKVFGLNAARVYGIAVPERAQSLRRDRIAQERLVARAEPDPEFRTYGPRTRREFLRFKQLGG